jgi:hypothetical protein
MDAWKSLGDRLQLHTLRWLGKGQASAWLIAGTFVFAGFSAAALNAPAGTASHQDQGMVGTSSMPAAYPGCYADPDGDGHIFCDGSVQIANLPPSFGYCFAAPDGDNRVICEGTGR